MPKGSKRTKAVDWGWELVKLVEKWQEAREYEQWKKELQAWKWSDKEEKWEKEVEKKHEAAVRVFNDLLKKQNGWKRPVSKE